MLRAVHSQGFVCDSQAERATVQEAGKAIEKEKTGPDKNFDVPIT